MKMEPEQEIIIDQTIKLMEITQHEIEVLESEQKAARERQYRRRLQMAALIWGVAPGKEVRAANGSTVLIREVQPNRELTGKPLLVVSYRATPEHEWQTRLVKIFDSWSNPNYFTPDHADDE